MAGLANSGIKETKEALAYAVDEIKALEAENEKLKQCCTKRWTALSWYAAKNNDTRSIDEIVEAILSDGVPK